MLLNVPPRASAKIFLESITVLSNLRGIIARAIDREVSKGSYDGCDNASTLHTSEFH